MKMLEWLARPTVGALAACALIAQAVPASVAPAPGITPLAAPATAQEPVQDTAWDNAIARFASQLQADVDADDVGSIVAGVAVRGELVWAQGFGWADRDRRVAADADMIYRTGSISKSFTAVLLAILADDGALELDQPVRTHFPAVDSFASPPAGMSPITYRQLASHTAGLIREPGLEGAATGPISTWETQIHRSIPTTSFQAMPAERYSYSNIGFGVLGLALSRAAGQPFMELIEQRIFEPLGMTSSTFVITPALENRLATGYANNRRGEIDTEGPAREHDGRGYKVPNGGVYSTVGDLAKFMAAVSGTYSRQILSPESRAEVLRVQTPEDPSSGYGLGFSIRTLDDGTRLAGHGGSVAGYTANILFEPESGIGVVLLRNYNSGATSLSRASTDVLVELLAARAAGAAR